MSDGVVFDRDSAKRIGKVVRAREAEATVTSRPPRGRVLVPHSLDRTMMCKAQEAMVADDTEYTVKILEADGTEGIEFEVRRPNGVDVADDAIGFIGRDSSGQHVFIPAAAEAAPGIPAMIIAKANMVADDTAYSCKYLEADGTEGAALTARRPNGIYVSNGDVGFLGQDSSSQNELIPANMREEANMALVLETCTEDPGAPVTGQIWLRTDL